jgi:eukaryotic-like serine/threonine-protein kinase
MGEVYRARDTRLGREVALKVLPAGYSGDPERLRRFRQEAQAAGSLNHPNVVSLYDIGTHEGIPFVVSELLEGATLRERLSEGAIPLRKAVEYAVQIARGLAAAHGKGIVHRDLKPENLFLTSDGRMKILDFGLAKLIQPEVESVPLTNLPTTPVGTHPGIVMGTVGYMSPEQVRGLPSDHRSDIFAFGAVLYEMVSGARAFSSASAVETMSAILKEDPPEIASSHPVAPGVRSVLLHCLEKRPEDRFQSASDLAFNLEAVSRASGSGGVQAIQGRTGTVASFRRVPLWFLAGTVLGAAVGALLALKLPSPPQEEPPTIRFLSYSGADTQPAASSDGRLVAFTSARDGKRRIWLKQLPGGDEAALTVGPDSSPRFSPDGSTILFTREGARPSLYRIPVVGGEPRKVLEDASEGDWSPDGSQIAFFRLKRFGRTNAGAIGIAASDGRDAREIAQIENANWSSPRWSPDGKTIAVKQTGWQNAPNSIVLQGLDGKRRQILSLPPPQGEISSLAWSGSGNELVYAMAESIVVGGLRGGSGRIIRQEVSTGRTRTLMSIPTWVPFLDVAGPGQIVLGTIAQRQNLMEVPLAEVKTSSANRWLTRGNSIDRQPTYSPDGEWILFSSNRSGNLDLWKVSRTTGAIHRLTEDPADDWDPAFTRDGKGILWSSNRSGHFEIWTSDADGTGARKLTDDGLDAENPVPTPDGIWVVYSSSNLQKAGIWKIRLDGTSATRIASGSMGIPEVSPDGRYIAYRSANRTNEPTLDVLRLEDGAPAAPTIVVTGQNVAARPRWMPDGSLAFTGQSAAGAWGVYLQSFLPGRDTSSRRRPLAGFDQHSETETFAISPDGARLTLSLGETSRSLMIVEGLAGIPPRPRR